MNMLEANLYNLYTSYIEYIEVIKWQTYFKGSILLQNFSQDLLI